MHSPDATARPPAPWTAFLRLWFVLLFAYVGAKLTFDLLVSGWIDLRPVTLLQMPLIPLAQAAVFWVVTRGRRRRPVPET